MPSSKCCRIAKRPSTRSHRSLSATRCTRKPRCWRHHEDSLSPSHPGRRGRGHPHPRDDRGLPRGRSRGHRAGDGPRGKPGERARGILQAAQGLASEGRIRAGGGRVEHRRLRDVRPRAAQAPARLRLQAARAERRWRGARVAASRGAAAPGSESLVRLGPAHAVRATAVQALLPVPRARGGDTGIGGGRGFHAAGRTRSRALEESRERHGAAQRRESRSLQAAGRAARQYA